MFGRQRKSVTLDQFLQLVLCYGVNFLWGLRNWLHNKAERGGLIVAAYIQEIAECLQQNQRRLDTRHNASFTCLISAI